MKRIGHWIAFLIFGYLLTIIVLSITTFIPLFVGPWLISKFNTFWFLFIGGILISIYYYIIFSVLVLYYGFLDSQKPDYWVSNIFLVIVTLYFYYTFGKSVQQVFDNYEGNFKSFKSILFFISIIPAYLQILFLSLIFPFIKNKDL
jgi:hypothetical protein